jgi:glucose/arabinose dehydrogenase
MVPADHHAQTVLGNLRTRRPIRRLVLIPLLAGGLACGGMAGVPAATSIHTLAAAATLLPPASATPAPTATAQPVETAAPTARPVPTAPTDTVVEAGSLPPGFSLTRYADVFRPTSLAFGPDGRLYVASANQVVYALADTDGDGRAETRTTYADNLPAPLGLLWIGKDLYVSYTGNVDILRDTNGDGLADRRVSVVAGLPNQLHQNDGMALGPDGYIYLGNGSSCDACVEASPLSAAILRFHPNGTGLSVFASGLRNPYDVAFNAVGDLFATDNGQDKLGDTLPPEELNWVRAGLNYGWPDCWAGDIDAACANKAGPVAAFTAHSSADGLTFYEASQFPPE